MPDDPMLELGPGLDLPDTALTDSKYDLKGSMLEDPPEFMDPQVWDEFCKLLNDPLGSRTYSMTIPT